MLKTDRSQVQRLRLRGLRTDSIDAIALTAALSWVGVILVAAWLGSDTPLLTLIKRALWGAICIYSVVFVGLYVAVRQANTNVREASVIDTKGETKPEEQLENSENPSEQQTPDTAQQQG